MYSFELDRYYTGETADFDTRMEFHKIAPAHKFTAKADDWTLFLKFECLSKKQAKAIEAHIKRMKSKIYIQNLVKYPEIILKLKQKYNR